MRRPAKQALKQHLYPHNRSPKAWQAPGLLGYIAVAKYQDGLPLYRQEAQFKRIMVDLGRGTMARWLIKSNGVLQPVWSLLEDQLQLT